MRDKLITKGQAEKIEKQYDARFAKYSKTMGDEQAAHAAALAVAEKMNEVLANKKRNDIRHALAIPRIASKLDDLKKRGRTHNVVKRKRSDGELEGLAAHELLQQVESRKDAMVDQIYKLMDEFIEKNRASFSDAAKAMFGVKRDASQTRLVFTELLGGNTGDPLAKRLAESVKVAFDYGHARYKAAGGNVGYLENYAPQTHSKDLIRKVEFEEWYGFLSQRLDREKMIDFETGLPFDDARLKKVMMQTHDDIVNGGRGDLAELEAAGKGFAGGGREINIKGSASRMFVFKNPDSFFEYNTKFGRQDEGLLDMILGHISSRARDTAALEVMGPKPNAVMRHMDLRMANRKTSQTSRDQVNGAYDVLVGNIDGLSGDSTAPWFVSRVHSLLRAAFLGGASITAISDVAVGSAAARSQGIPAYRIAMSYARSLNPLDKMHKNVARDLGFISDNVSMAMSTDKRFSGGHMGSSAASAWGNYLDMTSNAINRLSGLAAMTKLGRDIMGVEFSLNLARHSQANTSWAKMDPYFRESAGKYDIGEAEWKIIKKTNLMTADAEKGVKYLRPNDVLKIEGLDIEYKKNLANNLSDWMAHTREIATAEPSLRTRSITTGAAFLKDSRKGSWPGTIARSFMMFKSFPVSIYLTHLAPMMEDAVNNGRGKNAAILLLGTTGLGILSTQLSDIAKGKTPQEYADPSLFMRGILKGGGMSLLGDFFLGDYSQYGRTPAEEMMGFMGPTGGLIIDSGKLVKGNLDKYAKGDKTSVPSDMLNMVKRYTPGSNLWYLRLAIERLLFDTIDEAIDPTRFRKRHKSRQKQMMRDSGQEFFWKPGDMSPNG